MTAMLNLSQRTLTALAVVVTLVACGGGDAGGAAGGGGTVIAGIRDDFGGFNSITNSSWYTDQVIKHGLFTPIVQYNEELEVEPYLAESWEMHGDTAVTFTLREGVNWHDGEPVTAEDVKFTFDMAKSDETGSLLGSAYLSSVESAEVLGPRQIRFTFTEPHAQALEDFWWAPMPKHLLEGTPPAQLTNAAFNRQPVGSGPFRLAEWRANDRLVLERVDSFPEAMGGPAQAERVVFRIVPEPSTILTELLTGGIHVDIPVEPDQTQRIETTEGVQLRSFPGNTMYYIGWNNQRAPFTDPMVRRAMTMAINRQEIIDALLEGYGSIASSTIPNWHRYYPEVAPLQFDPRQAQQLLEQAGWVDRDGDGVRENAQGQPLSFTLMTSERPLQRAVVEVVQSQLRDVGANVEIQVLEFQTMLSQHRERQFDAVLSNWVLDNYQMASAPYSLFHSSQADVEGSANRSGVRDPQLDRLIEQGAAATDPEEATQVWTRFTERLQETQPFTFMFWLDELAATRTELGGVTMDQRGELATMADWTVR